MGNLRASSILATLTLAACGSDHAAVDASITIVDAAPDAQEFLDAPAPVFDFSCMGTALPTTADANITASGTVQQVSINGTTPSVDPLDGAALTACNAAATTCNGQDRYATDTSANGGMYSLGPMSTGGTPLDAYIEMTNTGSRTVYVYPASPLTMDQGNIPVLTMTPGLISALGLLGCTQSTGNGMLAFAVSDCANMPINDAPNLVLAITQGGSAVAGTTVIDLGTLNAQAGGVFLVCNVPPNAVTTVGATYKTMALRAHDVRVVAGATTSTILRPGP